MEFLAATDFCLIPILAVTYNENLINQAIESPNNEISPNKADSSEIRLFFFI